MKTKIILPIVSLAIIAILGGLLAHEVALRHRALKNQLQYETEVFVQLYQNLDRGEVESTKQRLGALVTTRSGYYKQYFSHETDIQFAPTLAEADVIKAKVSTKSK